MRIARRGECRRRRSISTIVPASRKAAPHRGARLRRGAHRDGATSSAPPQEHLAQPVDLLHRRRSDDHDRRCGAAGAGFAALHRPDQHLDGIGNIARRCRKALLEIVGPQHEDDQVERHVRFEADRQRPEAVLVAALDRIVAKRRAAGMAFLDDLQAAAELPPENSRPAPVRRKAVPPDAGQRRHGAVGVGVP